MAHGIGYNMSRTKVWNILQGFEKTVANTNAVPANSNLAMPVYNKEGTLLGYVPVFTSLW